MTTDEEGLARPIGWWQKEADSQLDAAFVASARIADPSTGDGGESRSISGADGPVGTKPRTPAVVPDEEMDASRGDARQVLQRHSHGDARRAGELVRSRVERA